MIENTSERDHFIHMAGLLSGSDRYITEMESAGQQQLVNAATTMPADGPWEELEALGFGAPEPSRDALFVTTSLPEGWSKEGSDHAMWSYIVDERGVRRVAVFYKAAFYDRRADCQMSAPGPELANEQIYGNEPVQLPDLWEVLTASERTDFAKTVDAYFAQAKRYPENYADRMPRVKALRVLISKAASR